MNLRKEHRKEQGQAAQRDFDIFWNDHLLGKAEYYGLRPLEIAKARSLARLAFFAGCFADFRYQIADDDEL